MYQVASKLLWKGIRQRITTEESRPDDMLLTRRFGGRLSWFSDPVHGRRDDSYCLGESGVLHVVEQVTDCWAATRTTEPDSLTNK